jgi:hypothetical protein
LGRRAFARDKRWQYGAPPASNANFAWVQHIVHRLAPTGMRLHEHSRRTAARIVAIDGNGSTS